MVKTMAVNVRAYAKINLSLEVISQRDDNYHELFTVIQAVGLFDELKFSETLDRAINVYVEGAVDNNKFGLINRSAQLMMDLYGTTYGADITLKKNIPVSSGLGGGSSNAAATILALNQLWDLDLPKDSLMKIGMAVGSDVGYFIDNNGTALVTGRGENIQRLKHPPEGFALIITSKQRALTEKTKSMFSLITAEDFTDGSITNSFTKAMDNSSCWAEIYSSIEPINCFGHHILNNSKINDIEKVYAKFKERINQTHFSGTGPSFYSIFDDYEEATDASNMINFNNYEVHVVPLTNNPVDLRVE